MKRIVSIQDVVKGNLKSGKYTCIDIEADYTLNIGYGEIEIFHIAQGLLKNGRACQFAFINKKLFFRVVQKEPIVFINIHEEALINKGEINEILIDSLPIYVKEIMHDSISSIQIKDNEILLVNKDMSKGKLLNPFISHLNTKVVHKSPFRKVGIYNTNKSESKQITPDSRQPINRINSNNNNTIFSNKENENGLLR